MKRTAFLLLAIVLFLPLLLAAQTAKLPREKAGKISPPTGKIAYFNDKNLWVMDGDGSNAFMVVNAINGDSRISWSPDGKEIAFARKGQVDTRTPNNLGGQHKIYDLFIGYPDSAESNPNFWYNFTTTYGAKYPQWLPNNRVMFTNDMNAHLIDPERPNYQTCFIDPDGGGYEIHRTDYDDTLYNIMMPTVVDNKYAYVLYKTFNPMGVAITTLEKRTFSEKDIGESIKLIPSATAPAWSPDGKWLAYVNSNMSKQGIYITNFELTENYLIFRPTVGRSLQTYPLSWSSDSKWITFGTSDGSLWIIDITGNQLKQITGSGMNIAPAWSRN